MADLAAPFIERWLERLELSGTLLTHPIRRALGAIRLHEFFQAVHLFSRQGALYEIEFDPRFPGLTELEIIYSGSPFVIDVDAEGRPRQTSLPAAILASMLENLDLDVGMRVAEIGSRIGYVAALMAEILGQDDLVSAFTTTEWAYTSSRASLDRVGYENIAVWPSSTSITGIGDTDRVLVSVGCEDVRPDWLSCLNETGFLLIPLQRGGWYPLFRLWKEKKRFLGRVVGSAGTSIDRIDGLVSLGRRGSVQKLERSVKEEPLWIGMLPERLTDFWFFVGLEEQASQLVTVTDGEKLFARGLGIDMGPSGWAIVTSGSHKLLGHSNCLEELHGIYQKWEKLGMPRKADYVIELVERRERKSEGQWVFDGAYYSHLYALK